MSHADLYVDLDEELTIKRDNSEHKLSKFFGSFENKYKKSYKKASRSKQQ